MKKVFMIMLGLLAMMTASLSVKAQDISVTLIPGWTWIGFPKTEAMDIADALGDFAPEEGDVIRSKYGMARYHNGVWRGNLQRLTPGLGYMYYNNRAEPVNLVFVLTAPQSQVTVTTSEPMLVTAISAIGGGEVTTNDGAYIIVKGLCWATHENPTTNDDFYEEAESGVGTFSISMTELNIATTYYVRAYAVTPNGTVYGDQKTFTTRDGIPTVTTAEVTNIRGESATCGGNVTNNCGLTVIARGVCWSTSPNPTLDDTHTTNGSGNGSFTSSITGLTINTTYYVRSYATTSAGTGYGEQVSFTTRNGIPTLTTAEVTNIGSACAYSGGNITDDGGLAIIARGVCWSTSLSPTLADSHTTNDNGVGSFTSFINGLSTSTTYYVRAYATNSFVTVYGNQLCFTTTNDDHEYVDLGLPSGLLWATCNVGADRPEDYGDYFAWGETQPKDYYDWDTYQYFNGGFYDEWGDYLPYVTKYCDDSSYGYNGFTDNLTTLLPEDDVATTSWGSGWRMPTKEEWQELLDNTNRTWTTQNGVNGLLFIASNGNSIFLPATCAPDGSFYDDDSWCAYWSSSLTSTFPICAWWCYFGWDIYELEGNSIRCNGLSVRPVRSASQNNVPTGAIDGKFTINANGDQVYFSQGNLQYIGSASTPYWKFANNQWDILGTTTGQNSSSQNVDRDLFGWGTSGYNHGALCYQPWNTSTTSSDYYAYGNYTYNLYDQTGKADWGYNSISNGGFLINQWRTLTKYEWDYIFNTRTTASGVRYAKAKVNNVNGVILLPDNWSSSTYSLSSTNTYNASFSSNTITASQWTTLEDAGAVFLPVTGRRYGTSVDWVSSYGGYWSAGCAGESDAGSFYFNDSNLNTSNNYPRCYGRSVRLVCPAE